MGFYGGLIVFMGLIGGLMGCYGILWWLNVFLMGFYGGLIVFYGILWWFNGILLDFMVV
jgi:hypothetical protein